MNEITLSFFAGRETAEEKRKTFFAVISYLFTQPIDRYL